MSRALPPKVPRRPPAPLVREDGDVRVVSQALWRVHRTVGPHVLPWSALRTYGPISQMRYDPHPLPLGDHPGVGVTYAAADIDTAVAEAFQSTRTVDTVSGNPHLTSWEPTRPLRLLDLTGTWGLRNHASNSLSAAPRSTCRAWAQVIHETWPDLDGLWVVATTTGEPSVVLWGPAADTFPANPGFSRPLNAPLVLSLMESAAAHCGYRML